VKDTEIIEALRSKLSIQSGRHLYGVLGDYPKLAAFAEKIQEAKTLDGKAFPPSLSVNQGILETIPDHEFLELVQNEARRPEPTVRRVEQAFEVFLRAKLKDGGLLVLSNLEILFAYQLELNLLRTLATDNNRVLLLLPGKREGGRIVLFPSAEKESYTLPSNLIADNHLWELRG
jgi:hypothetical protein